MAPAWCNCLGRLFRHPKLGKKDEEQEQETLLRMTKKKPKKNEEKKKNKNRRHDPKDKKPKNYDRGEPKRRRKEQRKDNEPSQMQTIKKEADEAPKPEDELVFKPGQGDNKLEVERDESCLLYTSPSPRD